MSVTARTHLSVLVGTTIQTLTGRSNTVIEIRGADVIVGTARSPNGQAIPISHVQRAMDILASTGEIKINVETVGYRSAFIGAALASLPGAIALTNPCRVTLQRP